MENYVYGLLRDYVYTLSASWECWDGACVCSSRREKGISFLEFYETEMERAPHLAKSTRKNHWSTFCLLRRFAPDLNFADLTYAFLCAFEKFMIAQSYSQNTIAKHMRHLKRYVNQAYYAGWISDRHLFDNYKIKEESRPRNFLTPDELKRIEELKGSQLKRGLLGTRDMFLFSCYTGLRYSDVTRLTMENFQLIEGQWWLFCQMKKTGESIRLPLHLLFGGKAVPLFLKYRQDGVLFSAMLNSNARVNKQLKRIAELAHINKRITFHVARHTCATLLLYQGVNITTIQKLLGHRSVLTTQAYSKVIDATVIRDLSQESGSKTH